MSDTQIDAAHDPSSLADQGGEQASPEDRRREEVLAQRLSGRGRVQDGVADTDAIARLEARDQEMKRLRWQCRRGMLELDLLLNRFLETGYSELDDQSRTDFARLLNNSDQILQDWLVGDAVPADPALGRLVPAIRRAMRTQG